MATRPPNPSYMATRRGRLTLALLCAVAFLTSSTRASALAGGLASDSGVVIGARMAQGIGAAMMLPAALSILTTTFTDGPERHKALGAWGGMAGLGSAAGVLLGGLLTQGLGWRWVFLIKPPLCAIVLVGAFAFIPNDRRRARLANFDILGALLATAGALLLVYALVRAPAVGWSSARTIGGLACAAALLAVFVVNVQRSKNPLLPLLVIMSIRLGARFAAATTAANAGVPPQTAGLAAALFNASQWIGGALGLAIFSAVATARTTRLLAAHAAPVAALDAGFHQALIAAAIFLLAATLFALRTTSTRGELQTAEPLAAQTLTDQPSRSRQV